MNEFRSPARLAAFALALACAMPAAQAQRAGGSSVRTGDYIVAVVNQELVTASEVQLRIARLRDEAARNRSQLPPTDELRQQILDALIDERVQVTYARDSGTRVDEVELDRAVANVAAQNQVTLEQLRERLRRDGIDYVRFRNTVRDQLLVERVREREVQGRIRITDDEIDAALQKRREEAGQAVEYNIAQILVAIPDGADVATVAQRRARVDAALARVRGGEAFDAVAKEISQDGNREQGGAIGMRPAARLPDVFVEVVRKLKPGEVAAEPLRTGAGFHILKLVEKREGGGNAVMQTRARHILLRPSAQLSQATAAKRLSEMKQQIIAGRKTFEQLARENSEDGSAPQGGDLGWTAGGAFVPEFEETMNALPLNGISEPIVSRFGVHLIQVLERREVSMDTKQQREQVRNVLREQKFEEAYAEWIRDLRARAYVEMREPPQQ